MKRQTRQGVLSAAAAALLLLLCFTASASPAPAPTKAAKGHGLYWGAWIGDQITGTQPPWDMSAVSGFERLVGKGLSVIQFAAPFADCSSPRCAHFPFPSAQMQKVRAYGAIPFLSWSSASLSSNSDQPDFQLADLIHGKYDSYIRGFAREAAAWGHPFFLRFNWEMNGTWFPWSEGVNGNKAGEYVAAWRHVHDIFTAGGATNATWTWCPYAGAKHKASALRRLYPGKAYVDWTCMDGYNWSRAPGSTRPWMSFDQIFASSYRAIESFAPDKPMLLAEIASNGAGSAKAAWIRQMFSSIASAYPGIRGLVWFDQFDRDLSWPIETTPAITRAFSLGIQHHLYRGSHFGGLSTSPIPPPR